MKRLTETKALGELQNLKTAYREFIRLNYEHKAADCQTCPTQGVCCTDAHFVNIRITRLEASAIQKTLEKLSAEKQTEIYHRAEEIVEKYELDVPGDSFDKTYSCPLFEKGVGCLVHKDAKPAPCISHACYEKKEDLPPEKFQETIENRIGRLNTRTYGSRWTPLPLPVWLKKSVIYK